MSKEKFVFSDNISILSFPSHPAPLSPPQTSTFTRLKHCNWLNTLKLHTKLKLRAIHGLYQSNKNMLKNMPRHIQTPIHAKPKLIPWRPRPPGLDRPLLLILLSLIHLLPIMLLRINLRWWWIIRLRWIRRVRSLLVPDLRPLPDCRPLPVSRLLPRCPGWLAGMSSRLLGWLVRMPGPGQLRLVRRAG